MTILQVCVDFSDLSADPAVDLELNNAEVAGML